MAPIGRSLSLNFLIDSLRTELAIASIRSLALNLSSKLLVLVASVLLARWLGADGFGIYASSIAVALVLGVIAQLGLPTLVIRALPAYELGEHWGLMRGLLQRSNEFVMSASLLLAGIGAVIIWSIGDRLTAVQSVAMLWAMALIPVAALNALSAAALRGLHHVVAGQLSESLIIPALFVVLIAASQFAGQDGELLLTPDVAVALRLAATGAAFAVGIRLLAGRLPAELRRTVPEYDTANWMRAAVPLLLLSGATIVTTQTDVLMLVALQDTGSAGIYHAAARGAGLVAFSLFVVNTVVQPAISRLHTLGDLQRLQTVVTVAARLALALAIPVALTLALFAEPILNIFFGPDFARGAMCLVILCAAQVVNVSAGLVGQILIMTGHVRDAAMGMILGALVNVVLNAILIPKWGIEGAAFATGISVIVWNIFLAIRVKSKTGLSSGVFRSTQ